MRRSLATLTQKRESLDRISNVAATSNYNLLFAHPDLFKKEPVLSELKEAPERIYYSVNTTCNSDALSKNKAALNGLAANMNRYSSTVNRFGIVPWAEQVTEIRMILEAHFKQAISIKVGA